MRKILILFVLAFTVITAHAQKNIKSKNEKDTTIAQLTKDAKLTDLIRSPDGKWTAFVKKSNFIVPNDCFYFFSKGDHADEIWIVNRSNKTKKLLVRPQFSCRDVSKVIIDPHNLQFSPDSETLYFETSAWVTSGAIHAINVDRKHLRFVTDGSDLRIVQSGSYKGDLIVNQHRYRFKGDTPLGSYNADWLFTSTGKQIKLYRSGD